MAGLMAANLRPSASSPLALAHQSIEAASLTDSVFAIRRRSCPGPAGITLGQLLTRTHDAMLSGEEADCPVCGGTLAAHGREARCGECNTRLA